MAVPDGKPSIMFAVPSGLGHECVDLGRWLFFQGWEMGRLHLADKVYHVHQQSSRILLNRNCFVEQAIERRVDYLLMVDPDMVPDIYCSAHIRETREGAQPPPALPSQKPFLPTALNFLRRHPFAVIGAPATCDPPRRRVNAYVFDQTKEFMGRPATHKEAEQRTREGIIEQVAAIGTGLILIPMPVFFAAKRPFFDDVYNADKTFLDVTQDVYFTRNLTEAGVEVYAAWCSYAGHRKGPMVLGCPGIDDQWATREEEPLPYTEQELWKPPVTLE